MTRPRRAVINARYDVRPRRDGTNLVNVWLTCGHHTVVEEKRPSGSGPWVVTLPDYAPCPECVARKRGGRG